MISLIKKHPRPSIILAFILITIICISIAAICSIDRSTSLLQAYQIAYNEACKYCDKPAIIFITSIDEPGSTSVDGKNGKRRYWNTIFVDPDSSDRTILITIHDQRVVTSYEIQEPIDKTQLIDMANFRFSSEKAVSISISRHGLLPGKDWARGYHFVLRSFDNGIDFQVVGLNGNNQRTRIAFDGNGLYIKSLVKR